MSVSSRSIQSVYDQKWYSIFDCVSFKNIGSDIPAFGRIISMTSNDLIVEILQLDCLKSKSTESDKLFGLRYLVYCPHLETSLKWKQIHSPIFVGRGPFFENRVFPFFMGMTDVFGIEYQIKTVESKRVKEALGDDIFLEGTSTTVFPLASPTVGFMVQRYVCLHMYLHVCLYACMRI
jgi:hypothetical protein